MGGGGGGQGFDKVCHSRVSKQDIQKELKFAVTTHAIMYAVSVDPSNPVAFVGSKNYTLRCILVTASTDISRLLGVTWLLNGTILESLDLVDVSPDFDTIGTGIGILTFANLLSEYNYTTIQCRGHQESGRNDTSESVVLRLQGKHAC